MSTPVDSVDFYFGLGSRYSYLAFTQLDRIERARGCRFVLLPLSSVELLDMRGQSPFRQPGLAGQYDWHYRRRDAEAWADFYRVPYVEPKALPDDHRLLARACWAAHRLTDMRTFCGAIFQAVFVDHDDINRAMCIRRARDLGLDQGEFERALDDGAVDALLTQVTHQAIRRGVFGVPSFLIGDQMFWGNDRLVLLENYLSRPQNTSR